MSFVVCVAFWIKSRKKQHLFVNLKDRKNIIDLDAEEKMMLNSIKQKYVNRISGVQR
jgi:hypothetical protein